MVSTLYITSFKRQPLKPLQLLVLSFDLALLMCYRKLKIIVLTVREEDKQFTVRLVSLDSQ